MVRAFDKASFRARLLLEKSGHHKAIRTLIIKTTAKPTPATWTDCCLFAPEDCEMDGVPDDEAEELEVDPELDDEEAEVLLPKEDDELEGTLEDEALLELAELEPNWLPDDVALATPIS